MTRRRDSLGTRGPGLVEHATSALNGWLGDYLSEGDNGLQQPMAFYEDNRSQPGAPGGSDVKVMPGLGHLALARHPAVYEQVERWVKADG